MNVAGLAFAVVEDIAISQSPFDVLLALQQFSGQTMRWLSATICFLSEKGSHYEMLAFQPPIAIAFAQQPAGAVFSNRLQRQKYRHRVWYLSLANLFSLPLLTNPPQTRLMVLLFCCVLSWHWVDTDNKHLLNSLT